MLNFQGGFFSGFFFWLVPNVFGLPDGRKARQIRTLITCNVDLLLSCNPYVKFFWMLLDVTDASQVADDAVINICRIMLNSRKLGCPNTNNNYKRVAKNDRE